MTPPRILRELGSLSFQHTSHWWDGAFANELPKPAFQLQTGKGWDRSEAKCSCISPMGQFDQPCIWPKEEETSLLLHIQWNFNWFSLAVWTEKGLHGFFLGILAGKYTQMVFYDLTAWRTFGWQCTSCLPFETLGERERERERER